MRRFVYGFAAGQGKNKYDYQYQSFSCGVGLHFGRVLFMFRAVMVSSDELRFVCFALFPL